MKKPFLAGFVFGVVNLASAQTSEEKAEEWQPVSAGPVSAWTAPLCGRKN
ncbi:MAG: hypothetical protein WC130_10065 [Kiritimatiellia bacterium]